MKRVAILILLCGAFAIGLSVRESSADVVNVELGTAQDYSVLAGSTVTNTGPSVLNASIGLSPGSSVTGFPPGTVTPPGTIDIANPASATAKSDLTAAYLDAQSRTLTATVSSDLTGLSLGPGVYAAAAKAPLSLTGALTLDANGDNSAVFIFQTDSTLITSSASVMTLINGANACQVFWQVGSSATLGTNSTFAGSLLALTSITATTGVDVEGQLLAQNGAVTLDTNTFTEPSCVQAPITTTTSTTLAPIATTSTTVEISPTTSRAVTATSTTSPVTATTTTLRANSTTIPASSTSTVVDDVGLVVTGSNSSLFMLAVLLVWLGVVLRIAKRRDFS